LSHYTRSFLCWVFLRLSLENYLLGAGFKHRSPNLHFLSS
jgi:hypothetical protein